MRTTMRNYEIHISLKEPELIPLSATSLQSAQTKACRLFKSKLAMRYKFHISQRKPVLEEPSTNMLEDILTRYEEEEFLKAYGLDDAIIGVDENSMRLIYSCKKCIEILMRDGLSKQEAIDHFEFNVIGAYVGEKTPIWCDDDFYW